MPRRSGPGLQPTHSLLSYETTWITMLQSCLRCLVVVRSPIIIPRRMIPTRSDKRTFFFDQPTNPPSMIQRSLLPFPFIQRIKFNLSSIKSHLASTYSDPCEHSVRLTKCYLLFLKFALSKQVHHFTTHEAMDISFSDKLKVRWLISSPQDIRDLRAIDHAT
jgi:hypothetical protein